MLRMRSIGGNLLRRPTRTSGFFNAACARSPASIVGCIGQTNSELASLHHASSGISSASFGTWRSQAMSLIFRGGAVSIAERERYLHTQRDVSRAASGSGCDDADGADQAAEDGATAVDVGVRDAQNQLAMDPVVHPAPALGVAHSSLLWKMQSLARTMSPGRAEQALKLLDEACKIGFVDKRMYAITIKCMAGRAEVEQLEQVVTRMRSDKMEFDVHVYNHIIYGYAWKADRKRAVRTYEEMLADGIERNERTLSNMIMAYSWGDAKNMKKMLAEVRANGWTLSRTASHSVLGVFKKTHEVRGVREVMYAMRDARHLPNDAACAIGFWAARKLKDMDFFKALFEMRNRAGLPPRHDFFVLSMLNARDQDRHDEVLAYWRQLVCVVGIGNLKISRDTFVLALKSAIQLGAWEEVDVILEMMKAKDLQVDDAMYRSIIGQRHTVTSSADAERIARGLQQLEEHTGTKPGPLAGLQMAVVHAQVGNHAEAMPYFDKALAAGTEFTPAARDLVVRSLVKNDRPGDARDIWAKATNEQRGKYSGTTMTHFMEAAVKGEDVDLAVEIYEAGVASDKKIRSFFFRLPLRMLCEAGKLQVAAEMLKHLRKDPRVKPKLDPFALVCRFCVEQGNTAAVVEVVRSMRQGVPRFPPPLASMLFVTKAFIEHGAAAELFKIFDELRTQNRHPDPECFVLMADIAVEMKDKARATDFVRAARGLGAAPSASAAEYAEETGGGVPAA